MLSNSHYELIFKTKRILSLEEEEVDEYVLKFEKISEANRFYDNWFTSYRKTLYAVGQYGFVERYFPHHSFLVTNMVNRATNRATFHERFGVRLINHYYSDWNMKFQVRFEVFVRLEKN